jgi:cytochrome c553
VATPAAASTPATASANPASLARGRQLATVGDESRSVQACANCHGADGAGLGVSDPYLAGQHATYLASTLKAWRDGTRHNDPSGSMPVIAKALADADVQAVASWYAQLPVPPRREDDLVAQAPVASTASAVVSGPRPAASQAPQGVGTAPAALTGGAQGAGGGGAGTGGGPGGSPTGDSAVPAGPASAASR